MKLHETYERRRHYVTVSEWELKRIDGTDAWEVDNSANANWNLIAFSIAATKIVHLYCSKITMPLIRKRTILIWL